MATRSLICFCLLIQYLSITAQGTLYDNTSFNAKTTNVSLAVGAVGAAADVSNSGSASYTIPIVVPPGTNGVAPSLALVYNSLGPNGPLGQGWSLSGLSAITRGNRTLFHDGIAGPIEFSANDRFNLDGNRLVSTSGTYGAHGATYATEVESFATITSYVGAYVGPEYFFVQQKNGAIYEYGKAADSRIVSGNYVFAWLLSKIRYPDGNYIEFVYTVADDDTRISEIRYTGNTAAGLTPYNIIYFDYYLRGDANTSYFAGKKIGAKYLLSDIRIYSEATSVKKYNLAYGWDNINAYLKEVTESGGNSFLTPINSTIFKYGDQPVEITTPSSGVTISDYQDIETISSDYNGDGFSDILAAKRVFTNGIPFHTEFKLYTYNPATGAFNGPYVKTLTGYNRATNKVAPNTYTFFTNDLTGDGIDDIITSILTLSGTTQRLSAIRYYPGYKSIGGFPAAGTDILPYTGFDYIHNNKFLFPGDFNGDGTGDLLTVLGAASTPSTIGVHVYFGAVSSSFSTVGTTGTINIPFNSWSTADRFQVMDFNGDGKSDLMVTRAGNTEILTMDNYTFKSIYYSTWPTSSNLVFYGDFNGDRKMDVLHRVSSTDNNSLWYKNLSTGTGFVSTPVTFSHTPIIDANYVGDKLLMMDMNGDGKTDIFHGWTNSTYTTIHGYYSKGDGFTLVTSSFSLIMNTTALTPFDINGDGKAEVISRVSYTDPYYILYFKKDGKEMYLDKVKNGYGHVTQWIYKRMNEAGSFYAPGLATPPPVNNLNIPLCLAAELRAENGVGGTNITTYAYEEARLHKQGKGLMGFLRFISHNQTTGFQTIFENQFNTTYYSAAPYLVTTKYVPNNYQQVHQVTFTNQWVSSGTGRHWIKVNNINENKTFEGQTVTTANTYDNYGNLTIQTVNNHNVVTSTTTTTYKQAATPVPALPGSITVSTTRTGQAAFAVVDTFAYNTLGQLTKKVNFSGQTKRVITDYAYNNLGNQTSARVSPYNLTARNIFTAVYDAKGRMPTSRTTPIGTSTANYDFKWGQPTSTTTLNGLTTTFTYDVFGREATRLVPQGYTITTTYHWTTSYGARHYRKLTHPGQPDVEVYFDVLDREVRTRSEGWLNEWITTEKTYDARGNVATMTGPYKPAESAAITTNTFDAYNRLSRSILDRGGAKDTTSYSYSYSSGNLTTTVTNPAGQVSSKITDASGSVTSATDYGGTLAYTYFSHGQVKQVNLGAAVMVTCSYDVYARQTQLVDANAGTITYDYDALGQLASQINAKSQTHTMTYDTMGRLWTKVMPEGTTTYEYYTAAGSSKGQLKKITAFSGNLEEYTYDALGRLNGVTNTIDGVAHTRSMTYDTYDNLSTVTYPSGFALNYAYDANSYLNTIKNGPNTVILFTNGTMNGYNQYKTYTLGNGRTSTNTYYYGIPTNYNTTGIQNLTLNWNYKTGNLTSRVDNLVSKTETFTYDNLNRLSTSLVTGLSTYTMTYATNGNISTKTDAGTYTYPVTGRINAVSTINPSAGAISTATQAIPTYTSFLQPASISETVSSINYALTYTYGPDENRIKGVTTQNGATTNTRYYFGDYEKDITGAVTKHIHYISAGYGLNAIVVREGGADTYYYAYTDHLGSLLTLTNSAAAVVVSQNYDAWGRSRNATTWAYTGVTAPPAWLTRGYTGHEHLGVFALINMNGRLYDPIVGRMLSPDNHIQMADYSQNYNRYSYALNNPLKYTDPDGEFIFNMIIGAAIGVTTNGIENLINGEHFFKGWGKAAIFGAISGGVSSLIGAAAEAYEGFEKAAFQFYAHAFTGMAISAAQGGNPIAGFLSGGISSAVSSATYNLGAIAQIIGGGVSGGIGSMLGGGSFWDGARQGLITAGLNHAAHRLLSPGDPPKKGDKMKLDLGGGGVLIAEFDGQSWQEVTFIPAFGSVEAVEAPWEYVLGSGIKYSVKFGSVAFNAASEGVETISKSAVTNLVNFISRNPQVFNKNNWIRLGPGRHNGQTIFRIAFGAHKSHLHKVPTYLKPINKWMRTWFSDGHIDFPKIKM